MVRESEFGECWTGGWRGGTKGGETSDDIDNKEIFSIEVELTPGNSGSSDNT